VYESDSKTSHAEDATLNIQQPLSNISVMGRNIDVGIGNIARGRYRATYRTGKRPQTFSVGIWQSLYGPRKTDDATLTRIKNEDRQN